MNTTPTPSTIYEAATAATGPIDASVDTLISRYKNSPLVQDYVIRTWGPSSFDRSHRMISLIDDRHSIAVLDMTFEEIENNIINYLLSYDWEYLVGETVSDEAGR